jgi:hypothetical protein
LIGLQKVFFNKSEWRCIGHFSLPLAYSLQIPSTNGNKRDWQKKSSKQ